MLEPDQITRITKLAWKKTTSPLTMLGAVVSMMMASDDPNARQIGLSIDELMRERTRAR